MNIILLLSCILFATNALSMDKKKTPTSYAIDDVVYYCKQYLSSYYVRGFDFSQLKKKSAPTSNIKLHCILEHPQSRSEYGIYLVDAKSNAQTICFSGCHYIKKELKKRVAKSIAHYDCAY